MSDGEIIELTVPDNTGNQRVDKVLAQVCPEYSRSQLQSWLKAGHITVDGVVLSAKQKVHGGEQILITPILSTKVVDEPENISLDIRFEDEHLLIVNKPTGLVVHPAAGNWSGTLLNALLAHHSDQKHLPRAGIVHRLDKDTTGLMVVAKTLPAHAALVSSLQARDISRQYLAVVKGELIAGGTIEHNIGRHSRDRKRMAVMDFGGKEAITHYRIEQRLHQHTLLRVSLETGRTHQIRVHMSSVHHPLVGDKTYGGRLKLPADISEAQTHRLKTFPRQALHATRLTLDHPVLPDQQVDVSCELPDDMQSLIAALELE